MKYASLTGPLLGLYFPLLWDDDVVCLCALNTSKLEHLWGNVYSEERADEVIAKYGGMKLPEADALRLDYDSYVVQQAETMGARAMMYSRRHKEAAHAKRRKQGDALNLEILEHAVTAQRWMSEADADIGGMETLRDALVALSGYSHEEMLGRL